MLWCISYCRDFLDKYGVRVCVLGNISLLPRDIQELMAEGAEMTKHNDRFLTALRYRTYALNEFLKNN